MNFGERYGLVIMILALFITIGILSYDLYLLCSGQETISDKLWVHLHNFEAGTESFPYLCLVLPVGVSIQGFGLFIHLISGLWK